MQAPGKPQEQPLNVEIGKREADEFYRRRDRAELLQLLAASSPRPPRSELEDWIEKTYPDGFPPEWFSD